MKTDATRHVQNWDINEELPAEVEGPFHVAVATNVLHTGNNLKSALPLMDSISS